MTKNGTRPLFDLKFGMDVHYDRELNKWTFQSNLTHFSLNIHKD